MESQPQNPEFRNNPENFHSCTYWVKIQHFLKSQTLVIQRLKHAVCLQKILTISSLDCQLSLEYLKINQRAVIIRLIQHFDTDLP